MSGIAAGAMPALELCCFGPPTVRVAGGEPPADVLWRKHLALLFHLALSPSRARSRDHLLGLLWPEKQETKARHSLNEAIRRLRASLGADRLISEGDSLRLNGEGLDVDALHFDAVREKDPAAALAVLRGAFLEGFTVADAPEFEDWAAAQRARYRGAAVALLLREGEAALAESRCTDAAELARRALDLSPVWEPATHLLMRAGALMGDAAGALAAFHAFTQRLDAEIGEQPGRELRALAERVRTGRWQRTAPEDVEREPPLMGRPRAHSAAFALVESGLTSGAQCIAVTGEPGMGKTRLLDECAERLALAGAVLAVARPLASDHDAPWSTLRLLARSGLASAPGAQAADPQALGVLAALDPVLAERVTPREPRDHTEVAAALESLLAAIADEQPVGVVLDEAHYADGATIGAIGAAIRRLRSARVVLLLAIDPTAENQPRELLDLRREVGRGLPGGGVQLHPFSLEELRELVDRYANWCRRPDDRDRLARRLNHETGGNPFLAVTLLRGLDRTSTLKDDLLTWPSRAATLESPLPFSVPELARLAIVARVGELDEPELRVLRAASTGGTALDLGLIAALTELPVEQVEAHLDRLEQRRFVTYDGTRYAFTAALIAQVVRQECMPPGQRQRLRRRAAEVLAGRDDLESRVLRAELLAKVDPGPAACREAVSVAEYALDAGSIRTARRALFAAVRAAGDGDQALRTQIAALQARLV